MRSRDPARRASTFLCRLLARARFAYVSLLEFGNGDYAWNRFFDYVHDRGFDNGGNWRLHRLAFFRASFFALKRLAFATLFFGFKLLAVCLVALPRTDLEDLRVLPRAVDFLFPTVTRFLR
jgi:hypothetical protein